jgi:HEAT repeat protein
MRKKRATTAKEFAAQLKADSAYQKKLEQQAENTARIQKAEAALMTALSSKGYTAASLDELVRKHAPLRREIADALVETLDDVSDTNVREAIVRALGAAREQFNVRPLADLFERVDSPTLRWAIANTLAEARPTSLSDWIIDALLNPAFGKAREMLTLAAARTNPPEVANPVLVRLLDELPGHAALALAETGGPGEVEALHRAYRTATGWERERIGRTINIIARRNEERA